MEREDVERVSMSPCRPSSLEAADASSALIDHAEGELAVKQARGDERQTELERYFAEGGSLRGLFGLDPVQLETLYAYACQRYEASDFEGARQIFFALAAIDPRSYDYWLSLGLSLQKLYRHDEAIYCFVRSAGLRTWEPRPPYLAALSLQLCGESAKAAEAYEASIKWCGKQKEYHELRGLAEQSLRSLQSLTSIAPPAHQPAPIEGGSE